MSIMSFFSKHPDNHAIRSYHALSLTCWVHQHNLTHTHIFPTVNQLKHVLWTCRTHQTSLNPHLNPQSINRQCVNPCHSPWGNRPLMHAFPRRFCNTRGHPREIEISTWQRGHHSRMGDFKPRWRILPQPWAEPSCRYMYMYISLYIYIYVCVCMCVCTYVHVHV